MAAQTERTTAVVTPKIAISSLRVAFRFDLSILEKDLRKNVLLFEAVL